MRNCSCLNPFLIRSGIQILITAALNQAAACLNPFLIRSGIQMNACAWIGRLTPS